MLEAIKEKYEITDIIDHDKFCKNASIHKYKNNSCIQHMCGNQLIIDLPASNEICIDGILFDKDYFIQQLYVVRM